MHRRLAEARRGAETILCLLVGPRRPFFPLLPRAATRRRSCRLPFAALSLAMFHLGPTWAGAPLGSASANRRTDHAPALMPHRRRFVVPGSPASPVLARHHPVRVASRCCIRTPGGGNGSGERRPRRRRLFIEANANSRGAGSRQLPQEIRITSDLFHRRGGDTGRSGGDSVKTGGAGDGGIIKQNTRCTRPGRSAGRKAVVSVVRRYER